MLVDQLSKVYNSSSLSSSSSFVWGWPYLIDNKFGMMRESAIAKRNPIAACNKYQVETYKNVEKTPTNPRKQHPSKVKQPTESHHNHTSHCQNKEHQRVPHSKNPYLPT